MATKQNTGVKDYRNNGIGISPELRAIEERHSANAGVSGPTDQPTTQSADTITRRHALDAIAYWTVGGDVGILGITYKLPTDGCKIVGNGTLPHPLAVDASALTSQRDELVEALREASNWIDSHSRDGSSANEESADNLVVNIRTLLARVEAK